MSLEWAIPIVLKTMESPSLMLVVSFVLGDSNCIENFGIAQIDISGKFVLGDSNCIIENFGIAQINIRGKLFVRFQLFRIFWNGPY